MARTNAALKNNPQFKALLAVLGDEKKARVAFDRLPKVDEVSSEVQQLVDAGFSEADAKAALAEVEAPAKPSSTEKAEALVEAGGFTFAKGRVYASTALAEAIVRVHKTSKPEIVATSGVGRTKGILVYRPNSEGDVALQNLTREG